MFRSILQYDYFDQQAKEYVIFLLNYLPNIKIFKTMMPIKRQKIKCSADSGAFSWL